MTKFRVVVEQHNEPIILEVPSSEDYITALTLQVEHGENWLTLLRFPFQITEDFYIRVKESNDNESNDNDFSDTDCDCSLCRLKRFHEEAIRDE